jgi:hypothetical protein
MLFVLAHLHIIHHIAIAHPTCVFFSLVDDTHIIRFASNVIFVFLRLEQKFSALGLLVQLTKCVVWSPQGLDHFISLLLGFFTLNLGFCILGALVGSKSFIESFMLEALHEDLGTRSSFLMLANP